MSAVDDASGRGGPGAAGGAAWAAGRIPGLDAPALRQLAGLERSAGRRRPRAEAVRPRTPGEVVALVEAKVITRAEARRYLRLGEEGVW
jgi:hypothetical protein